MITSLHGNLTSHAAMPYRVAAAARVAHPATITPVATNSLVGQIGTGVILPSTMSLPNCMASSSALSSVDGSPFAKIVLYRTAGADVGGMVSIRTIEPNRLGPGECGSPNGGNRHWE